MAGEGDRLVFVNLTKEEVDFIKDAVEAREEDGWYLSADQSGVSVLIAKLNAAAVEAHEKGAR